MRRRSALRPPRVPFVRGVCVTADGDGEGQEFKAVNLSLGGLFVRAERAPLPGTHVQVDLEAAGRFLFLADGEVVRAAIEKDGGFGVRFTNLRPNAQALVEHLVARGGTGGELEPGSRASRAARLVVAMALVAGAGTAAQLLTPRKSAPVRAIANVIANVSTSALANATASVMSVAAPPPVDPAAHPYPGDFQFTLPTGAVSTLRVRIDDGEVAVMPTLHKSAAVKAVFTLAHPARLVIDVAGRQPRYSWQLEGTTVVKSVRVGARNHGTRVVVDLPERPDGQRYRVVTPNS
jgi:PilZ domain/AMIN domain